MTIGQDQTPVPASWYPDPANQANLRWWDGSGWTDNLMPNPAVQAQPTNAVPTYTAPVYVAPAPVVLAPEALDYSSNYVPMDVIPANQARGFAIAGATNTWASTTGAVWIYALLPLIALPAIYFKFELDTEDSFSIIRLVLLGVGIILTIVFASIDRSILVRRDHSQPPSGALGVIPPAYLIARTVKVGVSGLPVLIVAVLIQVAVVVYALLVFGVIGDGVPGFSN
jgi:hypothetical protein